MAAWLAFLKSRLLLPPDPTDEGPSGEELAAHLAFQLERLQAMREAAAQLMARDQKGRDFFARGLPEDVTRVRKVRWTATLLDLMQGYARIRTKDEFRPYAMDREHVMTMEQALDRMRQPHRLRRRVDGSRELPARRLGRVPRAAAVGDGVAFRGLARTGQGRAHPDAPERALRADPDPQGPAMSARPTTPATRQPLRGAAPGRAGADGRGHPLRHRRTRGRGRPECPDAARRRRGGGAGAAAPALRGAGGAGRPRGRPLGDPHRPRPRFPDAEGNGRDPQAQSRAAIETLAIVAYHQPVTRAEIEEIRGVSVSRGTIDQLLELEWIRFGRRRMTPGRPVTYVVTEAFLDHFGLESARDLPGLKELRAAGPSRQPPDPGHALSEDEEDDDQVDMFEDES